MTKINPVKMFGSGLYSGPRAFKKPMNINMDKISLSIPEKKFDPNEALKILNQMGVKNLRLVGKNTISGETLERKPEVLTALREMGVTTIVDLRADQKTEYQKLCESKGLKYFSFPLKNSYAKEEPFKDAKNFTNKLSEYFDIVDKQRSYVACNYGIDRTNIAITLNFMLNPKKQMVPVILAWDGESKKSIINTLYKQVKKILKKIPDEIKRRVGISKETEADLYLKVGDMNRKNKEY